MYDTFYAKFSKECIDFVQVCVSQTMKKMLSNHHVELIGYLRKFNDLLIQEISIVRIHSCFADRFPATRSRRVATGIKVAFLFSVVCNSPKTLTFFPERTNDAKTLKIGSWIKDNLLLIDRGFFKHETFSLIDKYGGSFISQVKTTAKPKIKEFNIDIPEHMCEQCIGLDIYETMKILKGKNIDATVKLQYRSKNSKREILLYAI